MAAAHRTRYRPLKVTVQGELGSPFETRELFRAWQALMKIDTPSPNLRRVRESIREHLLAQGTPIEKRGAVEIREGSRTKK